MMQVADLRMGDSGTPRKARDYPPTMKASPIQRAALPPPTLLLLITIRPKALDVDPASFG